MTVVKRTVKLAFLPVLLASIFPVTAAADAGPFAKAKKADTAGCKSALMTPSVETIVSLAGSACMETLAQTSSKFVTAHELSNADCRNNRSKRMAQGSKQVYEATESGDTAAVQTSAQSLFDLINSSSKNQSCWATRVKFIG